MQSEQVDDENEIELEDQDEESSPAPTTKAAALRARMRTSQVLEARFPPFTICTRSWSVTLFAGLC